MTPLSDDNQANIIEASNSTSRYMYLDNLLNIDNPYIEGMVNLYSPELQQIKANSSDTEAPFYLLLTILFPPKFMINAMTLILVSMVTFHVVSPILLVCIHVDDFYARNKCLKALLNFSNRVIGTISLERRFPGSVADTMNWFQN